jgi:hypothetical protein
MTTGDKEKARRVLEIKHDESLEELVSKLDQYISKAQEIKKQIIRNVQRISVKNAQGVEQKIIITNNTKDFIKK